MQLKQIQSRLPHKEKWNVDKTPKLPPKIACIMAQLGQEHYNGKKKMREE